MTGWSTELKVGIFVLASLAIMVAGYVFSFDGVRADEESYLVHMTVKSADGTYVGTPVRLAGVEIGSVDAIGIDGNQARMTLRLRAAYRLPADTTGELKATGLLGDYYVRVYPGVSEAVLTNGGIIRERSTPGDLDTITRNLEKISDDIAAITKVMREVIEDRRNVDHVEATLANVDALTYELRGIAERNSADIDALVDSLRRLSESMEGYVDDIAADVDDEFDRLKELTDELDRSASNVTSITGKIDRGEGTLGALVNDRTTIDEINETVENVNNAVGSIFGLRPELYYTGRGYFGTEPNPYPGSGIEYPNGNELRTGAVSNTIGINLRAQNDYWYTFELVDHPQGVVTQREVYRETTDTYEMRWTRERGFKFSFLINKRWGPAAFRLGIKEGGGGLGATFYAWRDHIEVGFDVFNFRFGSYPTVDRSGVPNSRFFFRIQPVRSLWLEVGAEQVILGILDRHFTPYVGVGFQFGDDNIRGVFAALPSGAL